jgi:prepilin-type N-terminal cleavage/methylation domain-containing protein
MRARERGFTLIELIVSVTIMVVAGGAAGAAIYQILHNTERNSDHMNIVRQVENAGDWINRDVQMAHSITTGNLTFPDFIVVNWTVWDTSGDPTNHIVRYYFEGLSSDIGTLKRNHQSTGGVDETAMIARYIYYSPGDFANSSSVNYQNPVLTVRLTACLEQKMESKEYQMKRRPNF